MGYKCSNISSRNSKNTNTRGDQNKSYTYDLGQAVATLSLQAMSEGIYTHQMGGFNAAAVTHALQIPDDHKVIVAFTLGYLGDAEILPPNLQALETSQRSRRQLGESVFTGSFGHKADFI